MTLTSLVIVAAITLGGVEDDGQLNLLFEGHTLAGNIPVLLAVTLPSELEVPRIDGNYPAIGTTYRITFSGLCQRLPNPTTWLCQSESFGLRNYHGIR